MFIKIAAHPSRMDFSPEKLSIWIAALAVTDLLSLVLTAHVGAHATPEMHSGRKLGQADLALAPGTDDAAAMGTISSFRCDILVILTSEPASFFWRRKDEISVVNRIASKVFESLPPARIWSGFTL